MLRLGATATGGMMNPPDNLSLTKRTLVGWMSESCTQRDGRLLRLGAEGLHGSGGGSCPSLKLYPGICFTTEKKRGKQSG
jgi:hypothetical protein